MQTKHFTLVVCPDCGHVIAMKDNESGIICGFSGKMYSRDEIYKLGLKKIEETGEEIWMGVKEE